MVINNLHIAELSSQFLLLILVERSSKVLLKIPTLFCFLYFLHLVPSTSHYPYFLITGHSSTVSFGWILFTLWPLNFGLSHGSVLCPSSFVICTYSFGDLWITMIPLVSLWSTPLSQTQEMYPATYLLCSLIDFQFSCPKLNSIVLTDLLHLQPFCNRGQHNSFMQLLTPDDIILFSLSIPISNLSEHNFWFYLPSMFRVRTCLTIPSAIIAVFSRFWNSLLIDFPVSILSQPPAPVHF